MPSRVPARWPRSSARRGARAARGAAAARRAWRARGAGRRRGGGVAVRRAPACRASRRGPRPVARRRRARRVAGGAAARFSRRAVAPWRIALAASRRGGRRAARGLGVRTRSGRGALGRARAACGLGQRRARRAWPGAHRRAVRRVRRVAPGLLQFRSSAWCRLDHARRQRQRRTARAALRGTAAGRRAVGVVVRAALDEHEALGLAARARTARGPARGRIRLVLAAVHHQQRRPDLRRCGAPASKRCVISGATGSQPHLKLLDHVGDRGEAAFDDQRRLRRRPRLASCTAMALPSEWPKT